MSRSTNTQNLKIQATNFSNFSFVIQAVISNIFFIQSSIRNMNILSLYIDVIKKLFIHKPNIALFGFRMHGVIFVKIKGDHILKAQAFFFVHSGKFGINFNRGSPGSES